MSTRYGVAAALAVGMLVGSAAYVFPQGRGGPGGGGKGGGKMMPRGGAPGGSAYGGAGGAYGGAGGYGALSKGGYSQQDQQASQQEYSIRLQLAQLQARMQAAQLRPAVANTVASPESVVDPASAISALLQVNGGKLPATGTQFQQSLDRLGVFVQLPIPFSAVSLESGLANPRVIIAAKTGGLDEAEATSPNLDGRLFFAANMEKPAVGDPRVTSVEFISWNTRRRQFDFGVIDDVGGDPQIRMLDGVRCFSCHKNRGPILGAGPWSNSVHNDVIRLATEFTFLPADPGARIGLREKIDGMTLFKSQAPEVDAGVRLGANLLVNREAFRLMARDTEGRKALVVLLVGITAEGKIEKIDRDLRLEVNRLFEKSFAKYATEWAALQKGSKPSMLLDFSPAGSAGNGSGGWSGNTDAVGNYDVARILGNHGLPARALPSNPRAFARPPVKAPTQASQIASASLLASTIGLSEGDRKYFATKLADAAKRIAMPRATPAALARAVFEGPQFQDMLGGGELPEREEFKDRFAAGLDEAVRKGYGLSDGLALPRREYASGPAFTPIAAKGEKEVKLVPTTSCLACHDVRGEGKARFVETIPALAFDPFDREGREAWLKKADPKRKQAVLAQMLRRLATDRDMPPEDSAEYELFRVGNPASFDEAKKFLEAALKKR